jgi:DNA-binding MarR family transcriptional regulator
MSELHSILAKHQGKKKSESTSTETLDAKNQGPFYSEIPDLFFDQILVQYKLGRIDILLLMYLYRKVWCRPNLYRDYGITQILSYTDMAKGCHVTLEDIYQSIKRLEELKFIETIRSGQYFVRKFFTKEMDDLYHVSYEV